MVTAKQARYSLNIGLHVFILFTFLTIFFFLYIRKVEEQSLQNAFDHIIEKQVANFLDNIDDWDTHKISRNEFNIDWKEVYDLAKEIEHKAQGELPEIVAHNKRLRMYGMIAILTLFLILSFSYMYFKFAKGYKIHMSEIIAENIVVFIFVGLIEIFFFTQIASKFVPVTPDFVATSILERVKYNVTTTIRQSHPLG